MIGDLDLEQVSQSLVDRVQIHLHDVGAFFCVALPDRIFDCGDGFFARQYSGDGKEAGLHDRVDPAAHPGCMSDLVGVDHKEARLFRDDLFLHRFRQVTPDLVGAEWRIQKKSPVWCDLIDHVVAFEKARLMAADEIRLIDQVG